MKNFKSKGTTGAYSAAMAMCAMLIMGTAACGSKDRSIGATGAFEAVEVIISSEVAGVVKSLSIEEGMQMNAGDVVGLIDTIQLYLRKRQMQAQIDAILIKRPNIKVQLASMEEQLIAAEREKARAANLVKAKAATTKQLDDAQTQIDVIKKQMDAQRTSLSTVSEGMGKDIVPLIFQVEQINDQLAKCRIKSPIHGTVLARYVEEGEMVVPGKAIFKIANMDDMTLRAYISGKQLSELRLNQNVRVFIDAPNSNGDDVREMDGVVTWISDKAEFTPKTIQTKDERANLVYAIKVKVKNDGALKIGMYGEVSFQPETKE